ncbi:MAG: hypothetical protein KKE37_11090, partial [Verrucomicrobia bacterium]|nr:hypothetical protein [Verrucomicrobiota bacterium]
MRRLGMAGWRVAMMLTLALNACGQEPVGTSTPFATTNQAIPAPAIPAEIVPSVVTTSPAVATSAAVVAANVPIMPDEPKERWWISDMVSHGQKDMPSFFGVRLANAPQAALVEINRSSYEAGKSLAVRLWGCNDMPQEFKGRILTALKHGDTNLKAWVENVCLAPATTERIARYSFDTSELTAGQYTLETSLFDESAKLVQQQVTLLTVSVSKEMEAKRKARMEEKAAREEKLKADALKELAENKAAAEAKAKEEAGKKATQEAKIKAKVEEKAKREAELKVKAEAEKKAKEAEAA